MTTTPVDALHARTQMQMQEVQLKQQQVGNLTKGGKAQMSQADKEKKLRESCEGFESIFIQKMWQQMRATVPKENPLQGREEQFWQGMYDQELSKKMASSGGIGLADMMYDQLSRNLVSASRTTASAMGGAGGAGNTQGQAFVAQPAPLMPTAEASATPKQGNDLLAKAPHQGKAHSIYAGAADQGGANASAPAEANTATVEAPQESSPLVQQFLAELREKQAVQPDVITSTQVRGQGLAMAQRAQHIAANRGPAQGVMPAQGPVPSGAQGTVQGTAPAAGENSPFLPTQASATAPHKAANPNSMGQAPAPQANMPAQAHQPVSGEALLQAQLTGHMQGQPQAQATQAGAPASPTAEQTPAQQVNSTFTTNVPQKRRSNRTRGQRMPSGQPIIRTLGAAPASPIAKGNPAQQVQQAQQAGAVTPGQAPTAAPQTVQDARNMGAVPGAQNDNG